VFLSTIFSGCFLLAVFIYFNKNYVVKNNLQINENKDHPWLTLRTELGLNENFPFGNVKFFFVKSSTIQEASCMLKYEPFYKLTDCEFFYFTGNINLNKNDYQKKYLVRSVKDKYTNGNTRVIVDSDNNLIIRYGFSWGFYPKLDIVDNPIVVILTHRPNQVFVNLFPLSED
jgi:hypothetical protein